MRWIDNMADAIRQQMRSFLRITPPQVNSFRITETMDYYSSAALHRIWERGDADELSQLYKALPGDTNRIRFWAAAPTSGCDINKLHTGIPGIMARILTDVTIADMNDVEIDSLENQQIWDKIAEENNFKGLIEEAVKTILVVGDGAFKVSIDHNLSGLPIIEFVPGDQLEYEYSRGRVREILFRTEYESKAGTYVLEERYGKGYVRTRLLKGDREVSLSTLPETSGLLPEVTFDKSFMMAQQLMAFKSNKYKGRGGSIFDRKADSFDSLDEAWSQWMDALRRGRSKEYIPENMLPRNPNTGEILAPNAFDHAYISVESSMQEGASNTIEVKQPEIPHESYQSTYITALDLCLQGVLSPSTLGIDVKKLDNADAQREKEKVTLYSRNKIVSAIQETIPKLVDMVIKVYCTDAKRPIKDVKASIGFGEYANPSFESQVETVGKGKTQGIMSIEACVDELYGDSKDDSWKAEEVARLKAEQGIVDMEEPRVSTEVEGFSIGFGNGV